jgi:hypothetical protein
LRRVIEEAVMSTRRTGQVVVSGFLLFVLSASVGWAQTATTAAVTGSVADPSGALVPDARITIANPATGLTRTVRTSTDGFYTFTLLPIGTYDLSVAKEGFQTLRQSGIVLDINQTAQVNVTLQLGTTAQTVDEQPRSSCRTARSD